MPSRTACSPGTSQDLLQSASTCPWSDSCTWAALNDDSCNWAPSAPRASTTSSTATQAVPCGKYRQHLQIEQSMPNESKIDMHDTHCIGLVGTQAAHILAAYVALQLSPPPPAGPHNCRQIEATTQDHHKRNRQYVPQMLSNTSPQMAELPTQTA